MVRGRDVLGFLGRGATGIKSAVGALPSSEDFHGFAQARTTKRFIEHNSVFPLAFGLAMFIRLFGYL